MHRFLSAADQPCLISQSICTENVYIGLNDEAIFTWFIPSWDANTNPVPSTPLPYEFDQTQPRIDRSPDWWISLDYDELHYDELQRDGEIRFVLPSDASRNAKLPILLDMFFVSGPFSIDYELPTVAYRYSLDVVVRNDHRIQEVKFEQKAYWTFPSKEFQFFPGPSQGTLQHGYSSTTAVRNYLNNASVIPRDFRDAIYCLVRIPPNPEDEDSDEDLPVVDGVFDREKLERRRRRRHRRRAQDQYPDLILTKLHDDEAIQSISFCKSACRSVYTVIEDGETRTYVADYLA
jgi:hypothetical protein